MSYISESCTTVVSKHFSSTIYLWWVVMWFSMLHLKPFLGASRGCFLIVPGLWATSLASMGPYSCENNLEVNWMLQMQTGSCFYFLKAFWEPLKVNGSSLQRFSRMLCGTTLSIVSWTSSHRATTIFGPDPLDPLWQSQSCTLEPKIQKEFKWCKTWRPIEGFIWLSKVTSFILAVAKILRNELQSPGVC